MDKLVSVRTPKPFDIVYMLGTKEQEFKTPVLIFIRSYSSTSAYNAWEYHPIINNVIRFDILDTLKCSNYGDNPLFAYIPGDRYDIKAIVSKKNLYEANDKPEPILDAKTADYFFNLIYARLTVDELQKNPRSLIYCNNLIDYYQSLPASDAIKTKLEEVRSIRFSINGDFSRL